MACIYYSPTIQFYGLLKKKEHLIVVNIISLKLLLLYFILNLYLFLVVQ